MSNFPDFLSGHTDSLIVLHHLSAPSRSFLRESRPDAGRASRKSNMTDDALYLAQMLQKNNRMTQQYSSRERQHHAWNLCGALLTLLSVFFQVSLPELHSTQRGSNHVARIRQFGMYIAHTMFGLSMSEVAHAFRRERTTVKHACHLIEDMRENEKFDRNVSSFEYLVRSLYPDMESTGEVQGND